MEEDGTSRLHSQHNSRVPVMSLVDKEPYFIEESKDMEIENDNDNENQEEEKKEEQEEEEKKEDV